MLSTKSLQILCEKQKILDENIIKTKNIVLTDDIRQKKLIAMFVEFGEFINEELSFKYWSNKKVEDKNVVIEEYIDGIHFLISIGNDLNFDHSINSYKYSESDITKNYLDLLNATSDLIREYNIKNYEILLGVYLNIPKILNYTEDEIMNSYNLKNEKNHQRQIDNY